MTASLAGLSSFGVEAYAEEVVTVDSTRSLEEALSRAKSPVTILGGGSNVIFRRHVAGTVIVMRNRGIRVQRHGEGALVTAAAGERWHDLVRFCLGQGLTGIENLALIPGTVGAAPIQNIGAYGVELERVFHSLGAVRRQDGERCVMNRADCRFAYRNSRFRGASEFVITSVTLDLSARTPPVTGYPDVAVELSRQGVTRPDANRVAEAVIRVRRRKLPDPRRLGNAGSFFKNPVLTAKSAARLAERLPGLPCHPAARGVKVAAARLIDEAGWKGQRAGDVGVWSRQPLVLVNLGRATGAEVLCLAARIQEDVAERFDVALDIEPLVLGYDD